MIFNDIVVEDNAALVEVQTRPFQAREFFRANTGKASQQKHWPEFVRGFGQQLLHFVRGVNVHRARADFARSNFAHRIFLTIIPRQAEFKKDIYQPEKVHVSLRGHFARVQPGLDHGRSNSIHVAVESDREFIFQTILDVIVILV